MRRKTHKEFIDQMNVINKDITIMSEYDKDNIKVLCKCNICGNEWSATPSNLLQGKGCRLCGIHSASEKRRNSIDCVINEVSIKNPNVAIISFDGYKNNASKLRCKCKIHGNEFYSTVAKLKNGCTGCVDCIKIKNHESGLKTHDEFVKELHTISPNLNVVGQYNGAREHIRISCNDCGYEWSVTPTQLLSSMTNCPKCHHYSIGEYIIGNYLDSINEEYIKNKTFDGLLGLKGGRLSYDFYLSQYNLLIEMQGSQHESPKDLFGGEKQFAIQIEHDRRKREYAQRNGYNLLEIWRNDIRNCHEIINNKINDIKNPVTTTVARVIA